MEQFLWLAWNFSRQSGVIGELEVARRTATKWDLERENGTRIHMTNKMAWALFSASLLTATVVFTPGSPSFAQERSATTTTTTDFSAQEKKEAPKGAAPARNVQPRVTSPQRTAPRMTTQPRVTPRVVRHPTTTPRVAKQPQRIPTVAGPKPRLPKTGLPKTGLPKTGLPKSGLPKTGLPKAGIPKVAAPVTTPRSVTPRSRTVVAARFRGLPARGAGRTSIHGHNYSAWRGGHRFRHRGGWRTFVGLSMLGAIIVGADNYYPYAYISAPENYCDGLSEDGCQMMWQPVQTIEGDVVDQCVAYCPWQ
jgi:hypothetical protein